MAQDEPNLKHYSFQPDLHFFFFELQDTHFLKENVVFARYPDTQDHFHKFPTFLGIPGALENLGGIEDLYQSGEVTFKMQ